MPVDPPAPSAPAPGSPNGYTTPWLSPPPSLDVPTTNMMTQNLDHSTVDGAVALLAQTEMSDEYFAMPLPNNQANTPPAAGLYNLLDDLINATPPISSSLSPVEKQAEMLGESDPRSNVIKSGVVGMADANVLVDQ